MYLRCKYRDRERESEKKQQQSAQSQRVESNCVDVCVFFFVCTVPVAVTPRTNIVNYLVNIYINI